MCMLEMLLGLLLQWYTALAQPELSTSIATSTATVVRVLDGDTVEVELGNRRERVRYIGIDTPEPYAGTAPECFASEASAANRELVANREVQLVADAEDRDDYNRLLRYVYVDGVFVNAELMRGGFATALPVKPNTRHASYFFDLETKAREEPRGLWSACR